MLNAFFEAGGADGDFKATQLTRGPWSPVHMHAGPPTALLGRAIERCEPRDDALVARMTVEILRPLPIGPVSVSVEVVRPGRSVQLLAASLRVGGEELVRAAAWRIRTEDIGVSAGLDGLGPPPGPETGTRGDFFISEDEPGYHLGMDWRFVEGSFMEFGPATAWFRMRVPLVAGEEPTPLQRVLAAADSGNGISAMLWPGDYAFVNTDLSVHLHRMPVGEWVAMDARTVIQPYGVGFTENALSDEHGPIGRAAQALFVGPIG